MHVPGGDHDGEERDDGEESKAKDAGAVGGWSDRSVGGGVRSSDCGLGEVERGFWEKGVVEFIGVVSGCLLSGRRMITGGRGRPWRGRHGGRSRNLCSGQVHGRQAGGGGLRLHGLQLGAKGFDFFHESADFFGGGSRSVGT